MIYRTNADPRDDETADEALEVARVARDRTWRRWRTGLGVIGGVFGGMVATVILAGAGTPRAKIVCHRVEVRYENAPHIPSEFRRSCVYLD